MDNALERPIVAADDEFRHALAMVGEHGQVNNATTVPPGVHVASFMAVGPYMVLVEVITPDAVSRAFLSR
jgi:hypothetical protein